MVLFYPLLPIDLIIKDSSIDREGAWVLAGGSLAQKRGSTRARIPKDVQSLRELFQVVEKGKITWEATFDAIRDPVMIIGEDYHIERANLAAGERAGQKIADMIGRHCYEIFAGRSGICPRCPLAKTVQEQRSLTVEIERLQTDRDYRVSSYPLPSVDERRPMVVHHYRDVTAERMLQKKLILSEKMAAIGMLSGGVAHEINNPLGGILAFTQLLKAELSADSQAQADLGEIEDAARRCKRIVEDLLSYSRPALEMRPQDINHLIEAILPMLRLSLREASVTLKTEYSEHLPSILGEGNRLQQVFLNIIRNAAEAMQGGGTVCIRTRLKPDSSELHVEVEDNGPGIKEENLAKIFDPFFTTKGHKGTGLGLSICDSIIQDHRGRIEVQSQMGHGSLFRIVFPVQKTERTNHGAVHSDR